MELLFVAIILAVKQKGLKSNNRLFALILLMLSIMVSSSLVFTLNIDNFYFKKIYLFDLSLFLPGLFLYLYIKSIFYYQFKIRDIIHFIPLFIMFVLMLVFPYYIKNWPYLSYLLIISALAAIIVNIIYLYQTVLYFNLSRKINNENILKLKKSNVVWLKIFISGCYIILMIKFFLIIINNLFNLYILEYYRYENLLYVIRFIYFISAFIFFYIIIYITITKHDFFFKKQKYKNSILKSSEKLIIKEKLINFIQDEKPYLDPEISLNSMADLLAVSRKNLSQIINQEFKQNFNDFINKYRIEECKNILLACPEKSILEVLLEAGFNSKPTFNILFKKYTGLTPKEYRKKESR